MNDNLTAKQKRFVAALALAPSVPEAAKAAGISERQGWRWVKLPHVKAELASALDVALAQAARRVADSMGAAVSTLEAIHQDRTAPAGARVSAARAILESGPRLAEVIALAERVATLEQQQNGGGK